MSDLAGGEIGAFRFVVLNDLHYTDAADRPWLEGLMRQVNATGDEGGGRVELCLVVGDLGELGTEAELSAAREVLRGLKMPFYVVPGNHDGPPGRAAGRSAAETAAGLEIYERLFPGRRNYMFAHRGWQFLGLDTSDGSAYQDVRLRPEARAFVEQALSRLDRRRPTVVFTHFPLGPGVPYGLADGAELLALLRPLNVPIVFGGHYHGMTQMVHEGVELVTNRCVSMRREIHDGSTSRGYFLCEARADGKVGREFVEYRGVGQP